MFPIDLDIKQTGALHTLRYWNTVTDNLTRPSTDLSSIKTILYYTQVSWIFSIHII